MSILEKSSIVVQVGINASVETVWKCFTNPEDIIYWNNASDDWHTPKADNDFREGGKFVYRMEARDGSFGFDFWGVYDKIITNNLIESTLGDDRKVKIVFTATGNQTTIIETFEAESSNPVELQRNGWQAILNNFKKYVESQKK